MCQQRGKKIKHTADRAQKKKNPKKPKTFLSFALELYLFQIVNISLPASAEVLKNGSSCGKENVSDPSLTITFGRGYLLTLNFTKNTTRYSVQHMYFTYKLSYTEHFHNAISKGKTSVKNANLKGRVKNLPFREPHECPLCPLPF